MKNCLPVLNLRGIKQQFNCCVLSHCPIVIIFPYFLTFSSLLGQWDNLRQLDCCKIPLDSTHS